MLLRSNNAFSVASLGVDNLVETFITPPKIEEPSASIQLNPYIRLTQSSRPSLGKSVLIVGHQMLCPPWEGPILSSTSH